MVKNNYCNVVQRAVVSTTPPVSWSFLWEIATMCSRDYHVLEEGQMMPDCSMCSNCLRGFILGD